MSRHARSRALPRPTRDGGATRPWPRTPESTKTQGLGLLSQRGDVALDLYPLVVEGESLLAERDALFRALARVLVRLGSEFRSQVGGVAAVLEELADRFDLGRLDTRPRVSCSRRARPSWRSGRFSDTRHPRSRRGTRTLLPRPHAAPSSDSARRSECREATASVPREAWDRSRPVSEIADRAQRPSQRFGGRSSAVGGRTSSRERSSQAPNRRKFSRASLSVVVFGPHT